MELLTVRISRLDPWSKNPRGITIEGMERLKRQLLKRKQYKPLIVKPADGDRFIVLGGNMRLEAMKQLGVTEVVVSVVHPKSEAEDLEYAMSDNDLIGKYDREGLAELVLPVKDELALEDFQITLGGEVSIPDLMKDYGPGMDISEKELNEAIPTTYECQECGYKW